MDIPIEEIERVLLAGALGAAIGLDREWNGKSAGLRTLMLVCLGAALFTIVSYKMGGDSSGDRIASNIVTGIGFIGAGLIFKDEQAVRGLTTSATVWATAAVGIAVGLGEYWLAVVTTAAIWLILVILQYFEHFFEKVSEIRHYVVKYKHIPGEEYLAYDEFFSNKAYKLLSAKTEKSEDCIITSWLVRSSRKNHDLIVKKLLEDRRITTLDY